MSQWTHVNASIRFDGIAGMTPKPELGIDVPRGANESLQFIIIEGDPQSVARFAALIYGDLRDYANVYEIKKYLARVTTRHIIRSGIAEINVESGPWIVMRFNPDSTDDANSFGVWEVVWESSDDAK